MRCKPEQPGTCDGYDMRQMKRDRMKLVEEQNKELTKHERAKKKVNVMGQIARAAVCPSETGMLLLP